VTIEAMPRPDRPTRPRWYMRAVVAVAVLAQAAAGLAAVLTIRSGL
jgi:hypothetical protein